MSNTKWVAWMWPDEHGQLRDLTYVPDGMRTIRDAVGSRYVRTPWLDKPAKYTIWQDIKADMSPERRAALEAHTKQEVAAMSVCNHRVVPTKHGEQCHDCGELIREKLDRTYNAGKPDVDLILEFEPERKHRK